MGLDIPQYLALVDGQRGLCAGRWIQILGHNYVRVQQPGRQSVAIATFHPGVEAAHGCGIR